MEGHITQYMSNTTKPDGLKRNKRGHKTGWIGKGGWAGEESGEKNESDQNILYDVIKELIKMRKEKTAFFKLEKKKEIGGEWLSKDTIDFWPPSAQKLIWAPTCTWAHTHENMYTYHTQ